MKTSLKSVVLAGWVVAAGEVVAGDWPNYRGAAHDGISSESEWRAEFDGEGAKVRWEVEVGTGFASFTVADGRVFTTGHTDGQDTVFALDALSGKLLWKHAYPADLGDKYYEGGTSSTPTVSEGRLYHLSRWGDAFCFDAKTGTVIWNVQVQKETAVKIPDWGFAGAPLVTDGLVILNVGEAGMALKKETGQIAWRSGDEVAAGYSTPYPLTGSQGLMVLAAEDRYNAIEATSGKLLWSIPWKTRYGVNAADPIQLGDRLFISSGYNRGCGLFRLGSGEPEMIWENKNLKNQFNSSVLINGHVYGIDDDENKKASLRCIELATGTLKWEEKSIGFGAVAAADGKLIIQTETGEVVIAKASPEGFDELARAQVLSGRCWTTPVLAHGLLYVRNSAGLVRCLDLRGAP